MLERVLIELIERGTERKPSAEIVVDEFDGKSIVRGCLQSSEKIHGLRVVPAVADESISAHVAGKQRGLEVADLLAGRQIVTEVAETSAICPI